MTEAAPALEVRDVEVVYHRTGREDLRAVAGVNLRVAHGQILGLVGESGCGKSTLARTIVGLERRSAGEILFEGDPVAPLTRRARPAALTRLQMVFQNPYSSLNPRRKIGTQLREALAMTPRGERRNGPATLEGLLEQVGLPEAVADRYPHQFSGGQRQRIAIARALAADPSVIVLDEPLSSLDASAQAQIANLLVRLSRDLNLALVLISHDLAIVQHIADEVAVMYLGKIVEQVPSRELWERPAHPYTEALIGAIPRADGLRRLPVALSGEVPDPSNPPSGCRFHPRCPYAFDRCITDEPPALALGDGREVACWLHEGATEVRPPSEIAVERTLGAGAA